MVLNKDLGCFSDQEIGSIITCISPIFIEHLTQYDERKYPPAEYEYLVKAFASRSNVTRDDVRRALVWKWGHFGKKKIPLTHEALILRIQQHWAHIVQKLSKSPSLESKRLFDLLRSIIGTYITSSFLLHLLRPKEVQVIDQHNFRAMNYLLRGVRPKSRFKKRPSSYEDVASLASFLNSLSSRWPEPAPSLTEFDRFLMSFGKSVKPRKQRRRKRSV